MQGLAARDIVYDQLGASALGRPRTFDETAALDAAVDRFWQKGFADTSVRDLASDMNIAGASLYNAFGDKRLLFQAALQRYLDREARRRIKSLDSEVDPILGLERFFRDLVASAIASDWGCLLVNSAMEIAPHDETLAADIRAGLSEIENGFHRAIISGQARGVVLKDRSPVDSSRLLLAAVIGILVLSRVSCDRGVMESIARTALAPIIGPKGAAKPRRSRGR